jgi:HAD superfamily hydrolase (TIGR01509 family)
MLEAIVFDFDGVLVDSEPLHHRAIQTVGQSIGVELDYQTYLATYIGFDDRDAFRYLLTGRAEPLDAALEERVAALCGQKQQVFEQLMAEGAAALPGAAALVEAARPVMPIAIASGATAGEIAMMLGGVGLAGAFELIVSADDVARSKPDPQSYALAVERLRREKDRPNLAAAACLAIEDTEAGLASAKAAGLATLGVTTTRDRAKLTDADHIVDSLEGVTLDALRQWFG